MQYDMKLFRYAKKESMLQKTQFLYEGAQH